MVDPKPERPKRSARTPFHSDSLPRRIQPLDERKPPASSSLYYLAAKGPAPHRPFLAGCGSAPVGDLREDFDVLSEEERWVPLLEGTEDAARNTAGDAAFIIEEEIIEEIPPGASSEQRGVIKRIHRKITRRPPGDAQPGLAALPRDAQRGDQAETDPNAEWFGTHYRWNAAAPYPQWFLALQQKEPEAFATCVDHFARLGRWPSDAMLGPGSDAARAPGGGFVLKRGSAGAPCVERARQAGDDAAVAAAFQHFARFGRWPRES